MVAFHEAGGPHSSDVSRQQRQSPPVTFTRQCQSVCASRARVSRSVTSGRVGVQIIFLRVIRGAHRAGGVRGGGIR